MAGYPENNFPAFQSAFDLCQDYSIKVLSPHMIKHVGDNLQWSDYLRGDLIEMLDKCSGLILINGWPQSKGARLELSTAVGLDWPVYYLDITTATITNMNSKRQ
jgi:hypothetical protein